MWQILQPLTCRPVRILKTTLYVDFYTVNTLGNDCFEFFVVWQNGTIPSSTSSMMNRWIRYSRRFYSLAKNKSQCPSLISMFS